MAYLGYDNWRTSPPERAVSPNTIETTFDINTDTDLVRRIPAVVDSSDGSILNATFAGREVSREALVATFGESAMMNAEADIQNRLDELILVAIDDDWANHGDDMRDLRDDL